MLTEQFSSKVLKALYKEISIIIPDGMGQTAGLRPCQQVGEKGALGSYAINYRVMASLDWGIDND